MVTVLSVREDFASKYPDLTEAILERHMAVNEWILSHPEEAQQRVADELSFLTKREFPLELVQSAWPRMAFRTDISDDDFLPAHHAAQRAGFFTKNVNDLAAVEGIVRQIDESTTPDGNGK